MILVDALQERFRRALETACASVGGNDRLSSRSWLRDGGRHGGGMRYAAVETANFNRVAINVSSVHYDDDPGKRLGSATAFSTIIHPRHPLAPSMHMHVSWTEMRDGAGYWRIMADLNPSIPNEQLRARFETILRNAAPTLYDQAAAEGDRYFMIPALGRTRGVCHFYLEGYATDDPSADFALAQRIAERVIDGYTALMRSVLVTAAEPTAEQKATQLAYHTLYFFQVLTLDRGTTSGLLVHDQNDIGIMGSLPAFIDTELLASWEEKVARPQDALVRGLIDVLEPRQPSHVTDEVRAALARVVREHYQRHPKALDLQAAGSIIPPTVDNHQ